MKPYYEDDLVTLYHGDCREVTAWLEADVLVTDPPYGAAWGSAPMTSYTGKGGYAGRIEGDQTVASRDAALSMWGNRPAVVFGTWRQPRPANTSQRLIWHKRKTPPGVTSAAFYSAEEEIYLLGTGWSGPPVQNVIATSEWRSNAHGFVARSGHPTPKPESLMGVLVKKSPPGVIADPFAGSGSTLYAAKILGRRSIGVEIDEHYCELSAKRLAQDTLFGGVA